MLDLTADQLRLLLTLTSHFWTRLEQDKEFGDRRVATRQTELEGIQERLKEALNDR